MSGAESSLPIDWFARGDLDIQAAKILLSESGPLTIVGFHLQQTIEKYLKGFLLSTGWSLRRIQDLEVLIQEAIAHDVDFASFLAPCQEITEYYIETRYPMNIHTSLQRETLAANLETTEELISLIRQKVTP